MAQGTRAEDGVPACGCRRGFHHEIVDGFVVTQTLADVTCRACRRSRGFWVATRQAGGFVNTIEPGHFSVWRFCCTSGMCIECRAVANGTKRKRVLQMGHLSEASAKQVAANWASYDAFVVDDLRGGPEASRGPRRDR
jgi:hypothetical protein